ncbi:MAG: metabolite traffic protein EboE, partial [Fimbriiglobus sp.]
MTLSRLPLSYCTNVHPGRTVADVDAGLDRHTVAVRRKFGRPLAAGLWLARPVVAELAATADGVRRFADRLAARGLTCHTLNAFPFGDFHSDRVKEAVYLPDWTDPDRLAYTVACAEVLAALVPAGVDGSISTVPLGFKRFSHPPDFRKSAAARLVECARELARIHAETGKLIRLAVEPEPLCVLETTPEAVDFFEHLWRVADAAGAEAAVREHVGLCYDVCHQAVEFEDTGGSVRTLDRAGVRINKVHLSCALRLSDPAADAEGRAALAHFAEPRYLHQTFARLPNGRVVSTPDLTAELA